MKKPQTFIVFSLLTIMVALSGCFPKSLVWSPDGNYAAFFTKDGDLYFSDHQGRLSAKVCDKVFGIAWLNDNQSILLETVTECKSWQQFTQIAKPELLDEIKSNSSYFVNVSAPDQWQDLQNRYTLDDNMIAAVKLYLRDENTADISPQLKESLAGNIEFNCYAIELARWQGGSLNIEKVLCQFTLPVWDIVISSDNNKAAFTLLDQKDSSPVGSSLWVLDLATGSQRHIADNAALFPDWTDDSSALVYVAMANKGKGDDIFVGNLQIAKWQSADLINSDIEIKTLAALMMSYNTRVRCLSDGKILFSSLEANLPLAAQDLDDQMQLYILDTKVTSGVNHVILRSNMDKLAGYDLNFFELSGNEQFVSLITHDGLVSVLNLETGIITEIQSEPGSDIRSLPSWRGDTELCYYTQSDNTNVNKRIALLDLAGPLDNKRYISTNWPDEVVNSLE